MHYTIEYQYMYFTLLYTSYKFFTFLHHLFLHFSCKVFLASKISKPLKRQGKRQILNVFCKSKRHFSQLQAGKKNTTALCHLLSCAIILHLIFQDFWLPVRLRKRFTWSLVINNLLWIILLYFKTEKQNSCDMERTFMHSIYVYSSVYFELVHFLSHFFH